MSDSTKIASQAQRFVRKSSPVDLSTLDFGKLPPQALDLEEAVLGAILIDKAVLDDVTGILKPESFYKEAHQKIYRAILELYELDEPVDILTTTEQLRKGGTLEEVGGPFYVADLTNRVASGANAETHARIVSQKFLQRELINMSGKIIKDAFEDTTDVFELLDTAEQGLFSISQDHLKKSGEEVGIVLKNELEQIQLRMSKADEIGSLTGVGSGFVELDRLTAGWQKSDLIIMAARPGMGKTALTLNIARNAAVDLEKPVAFFSLEMSSRQLVQRLISSECGLSGDKLRKGNLKGHEWTQLTTRVDKLRKANIIIDDQPAINIFDLRSKCRRYKSRYGIELVIVDYLQLMSGSSATGKGAGNREQEISMISRSLKGIAKELDIPVIALSQLSRAVETRGGNKRPQLSDLRESGAIEQDADIVTFLYRPGYYGIEEFEDGMDAHGLAEIIVAKHRNGALKNVRLKFIDQYAKFEDLDMDAFGSNNSYAQPGDNPYATITKGSRMNDEPPRNDSPPDFSPHPEEDPPF